MLAFTPGAIGVVGGAGVNRDAEVEQLLQDGAKKAQAVAQQTMAEVKRAVGLTL